jgi:hypothetical protein
MWRVIFLVARILFILGVVCLPASSALAGVGEEITIVANPLVTGGIANFTITYISETQLDFDWGYTGDATHIMIRGKYGDYPANITDPWTDPSDGYLVYYGVDTSASDTSMDFDANPGPIYYSAWAQKDNGMWYMDMESGWEESAIVTLIALILLALGLMIVGYVFKRQAFAFGAVGGWLLIGVYSYTRSVAVWDIYFTLFFFCMGLVIVSALEAMYLREKPPEPPRDMDSLDEYNKSWDDYDNDMERYRRTIGGRRGRSRKREDENNTRLV